MVDGKELLPSNNGEDPIASQNKEGVALNRAYANSKLAQILHSRAVSRKVNIQMFSICPGWVHTSILKDDFGQVFLKTFGFPSDGIGLSSTFNAMFRDLPSDVDWITNWKLTYFEYIPMPLWSSTLYIRDVMIMINAVFILPLLQKFKFVEFGVAKSSPESYDVAMQDSLYDWSLDAVREWL